MAKKDLPEEYSYSASVRWVRKNDPKKLNSFIKSYKEAFDAALIDELDDPEELALMEAYQKIGLHGG